MSALFDPFTQESEGLHRTHEGSGLNLAAALRLMQLADGDLQVDSDQGQETTVTLRFRPATTESCRLTLRVQRHGLPASS